MLLALLIGCVCYSLPLPIGSLSDYGGVLDSHGRERIGGLIKEAEEHLGTRVYILASWDGPSTDLDRYAYAVLEAWNLSEGHTILALFLKENNNWRVKVLSGEAADSAHPQLAQEIELGISDLVHHSRIEEAMVKLFSILENRVFRASVSTKPITEQGKSRVFLSLMVVAMVFLVAVFISRRICPRCGRVLRVRKRRSLGLYGSDNVLYYCRCCGFSRRKKREG